MLQTNRVLFQGAPKLARPAVDSDPAVAGAVRFADALGHGQVRKVRYIGEVSHLKGFRRLRMVPLIQALQRLAIATW